jgi:hypothetical protein
MTRTSVVDGATTFRNGKEDGEHGDRDEDGVRLRAGVPRQRTYLAFA